MEVLVDYRPALRARTGVGAYVHELVAALARTSVAGERLHVFSSSWKDRLAPGLAAELPGVVLHDHRAPGKLLNFAWHRLGWPPVERLDAVRPDVAHAAHPLLIPTRGAAVVTVHDLDFLDHPERTTGEIRRDYPTLVGDHARRADAVIVNSEDTRVQVIERLGVPPEHIVVVRPGVPAWARAGRTRPRAADGPILFVGTVEPRKNVEGLLGAYAMMRTMRPDVPPLLLVGHVPDSAAALRARASTPPFAGRVSFTGYVDDAARRDAFERASMLVVPSWYEGFGLPALEALALGVPVVATRRGALAEVVGDCGRLVDAGDETALASAMLATLEREDDTAAAIARGQVRAEGFTWERAADAARVAYDLAVTRRAERHAHRR